MNLASLRLLQLCSANLPIGAYAFSQGLETATEEGWLSNIAQTRDWLNIQLQYGLGRGDLPVLLRVINALADNDIEAVLRWNQLILALRETNELRLTDCATGNALIRVLKSLEGIDLQCRLIDETEVSFAIAFAFAAQQWGIQADDACLGYAWSWVENQVAAATKRVPLGQTQSQKLLEQLQPSLLNAIELAKNVKDDDIGESLPMLTIASCWHEHQYSRLFRS